MARNKTLTIIFTISLIIGLIHGLISYSILNFFTWVLIGFWLIFALKIFENIKRHREFNSPHNTAFFVILPLCAGIFYSIWGFYTGVFGENLLTGVYFSLWSLIFGFPYILYGSYSLYRCFKKYNVIYFSTKSVKARTLGYMLSFSVIIFILTYWITFYSVNDTIPLDFNLLLLLIATILIVIVFGFANTRSSLPALTRDYIANRTRTINNLTSPTTQRQQIRTTRVTNPTPSTRATTHTTRTRIQSSRVTPTTRQQTTRIRTSNSTHVTKVKPTPKIQNINNFKPRGSFLSLEDFKCIFCFKLPKLPDDKGRGVVVCPNCRYPSHADEFKDWMQTSNLCSRCSAPIPSNFQRNPKVVSVKNYVIIYRQFLKKK